MVKKKYKIGMCFGCQKCLYCGIDLRNNTCKCKKTLKPTKTNRTTQVKSAFPRFFNPTSSNSQQLNFIKDKNECFQYGCDLAKNIQLSFCSACNSSYQRLSKNSKKLSDKSKETTQETDTVKIIDLEVTSSEASTVIQNESKYNDTETENEDDAELEMEINYKLIIKQADGIVFPAKNYLVTISELDEFLLAIQNNITALLEDKEINANDYNVSFKSEKAPGAGTLLVDMCDFENFRSEYIKLAAMKKIVVILITMKKKEKPTKRKKKKSDSDDEEVIDDKSISKTNNSNKIPKISDISIMDQRVAKNVTELRKETWCSIHNRHCLKDREPHIEISNMMFSTWVTEMLNGLATIKEPPTHPSFAYKHPLKNRSQSTIVQDSINPFFSNLLQALVTPHFFQQPPPLTSYNSITPQLSLPQQLLPSMAEFLQQIDETEKTEDCYYFKFLEGFEKQRIKVKHLGKLNDTQFEACGVTAIGDIETIKKAAQKYK